MRRKTKVHYPCLTKVIDAAVLKTHLSCSKKVALDFIQQHPKLKPAFDRKEEQTQATLEEINESINEYLTAHVTPPMVRKSIKLAEERKREAADKKLQKEALKKQLLEEQPGEDEGKGVAAAVSAEEVKRHVSAASASDADDQLGSTTNAQQVRKWLVRASKQGSLVIATNSDGTNRLPIQEICLDDTDKIVIKTGAAA